jgi:hypothetical protein
MARLSAKALEAELVRLNGNMAAAARSFGVSRVSVFKFVQRRPKLRQVIEDCRETRIDLAEDALDQAVQNGEGWAISLTLKTIGKARGYIERTEIDVKDIDRCIEAELEKLAAARANGRLSANGEASSNGHP